MTVTSILTNPIERTRFLRFAIVGTIGAIVDFSTFNLLTKLLHMPPVWASVCSFATAITSNFIWNRYWTYPDSRSKKLSKQVVEFAIVNVIGVGIRTPIFAGLKGPLARLYEFLGVSSLIPFATSEFLGNNTALAIAVVVVMFWNYFVNRYWTYNDVE
jgi:putative flippase GtrA